MRASILSDPFLSFDVMFIGELVVGIMVAFSLVVFMGAAVSSWAWTICNTKQSVFTQAKPIDNKTGAMIKARSDNSAY